MASSTRPMTKSPLALAQMAYAIAQDSLEPYSACTSRKDFTQHQLFAILALKLFFRVDYRGVTQILIDFSDLRSALELKRVPHFSTLCYAEKRLLKKGPLQLFKRLSSVALAG